MIVYMLRNTVSDKAYIGITQDLRHRVFQHKAAATAGDKRQLYQAIRKHGFDKFTVSVLNECADRDEARETEKSAIAQHDTYRMGYNMSPGGEGVNPEAIRGDKNPAKVPATRLKIKAAMLLQVEERRAQMILVNPMHNESSRDKVRDSKLGIPRTEALKAAISATRIALGTAAGENNPAAILTREVALLIRSSLISRKHLATTHGVSLSTVHAIKQGRIWK